MDTSHSIIEVIRLEYQHRKARNPHYSLRSFAAQLGMGSGALSEIINGKRNLSVTRAKLLCEKLNLSEKEQQEILRSVKDTNQSQREDNELKPTLLQQKLYEVISSPLCISILALADLDDFELSTSYITHKLGVKPEKVTQALTLMRKTGLIEEDKIVDDFFVSTDGIPSRMIKNFHHEMLENAQVAIEEQDLHKRDISGITFAFDAQDLPKIKKEIQSFQTKLLKKYTKEKKDALYQLEVALFSLLKDET
ncbi:MAG: TIGR02147 family protein [Proteobacteria bacterium]|nr:TIGR02147 family protein [Pseudomonadota bacterium]